FGDNNGMAGIVAASDTDNVIERSGKIIDDFAFAFVSALRANDDDRFHPLHLSVPTPFPYASERRHAFGERVSGFQGMFYKPCEKLAVLTNAELKMKRSNPTMVTVSTQASLHLNREQG